MSEEYKKHDLPEYLPISKLCAYSGIPAMYIRRMVKNGEVECCRPGSKTIFIRTQSFFEHLQITRP